MTELHFWEFLKFLSPFALAFVASYLGYRFGLKKDRRIQIEKENKKFKDLRYHLMFSIDDLIIASAKQVEFIEEFKKQIARDPINFDELHLASSFNLQNLKEIRSNDLFQILFLRSKQVDAIKSDVFKGMNTVLRITPIVSENLAPDVNKYRNRLNSVFDSLNSLSSNIRRLINDIIFKRADYSNGFIEELLSLNKSILIPDKLNDISYMVKNYYTPLMEVAKEHSVIDLVQNIPELLAAEKQLMGARDQFLKIFDSHIYHIEVIKKELAKVKEFLMNEP